MDANFLTFAILIEIVLVLLVWIGFLHWRLSKHKKTITEMTVVEPEPVNEFEIYMQYINRELSDTKAHLDDLAKNQSDDIESINMYQYRLKHLDAEQKAMTEAKGDAAKFWKIYHSNIEFVYHEEEAEPDVVEEAPLVAEVADGSELDISAVRNQYENYQKHSAKLLEQGDNIVDLVKTMAAKNDSEELLHMLSLLERENDDLKGLLAQMKREYEMLMQNAGLMKKDRAAPVSQIDRDEDGVSMANITIEQNKRIHELNDIVGNLSLELEENKRLSEESAWVTRQMKEMEHVIIILEDENKFLREQIRELL